MRPPLRLWLCLALAASVRGGPADDDPAPWKSRSIAPTCGRAMIRPGRRSTSGSSCCAMEKPPLFSRPPWSAANGTPCKTPTSSPPASSSNSGAGPGSKDCRRPASADMVTMLRAVPRLRWTIVSAGRKPFRASGLFAVLRSSRAPELLTKLASEEQASAAQDRTLTPMLWSRPAKLAPHKHFFSHTCFKRIKKVSKQLNRQLTSHVVSASALGTHPEGLEPPAF
jgi:hypothetical protein